MSDTKSTSLQPAKKDDKKDKDNKGFNWMTILYVILGIVAVILIVGLVVYSTGLLGGGGVKTREIYGGM